MISSITKELELKETRQELETHRQEHSDQQQVSVTCSVITLFVSLLFTIDKSTDVCDVNKVKAVIADQFLHM